MFLRVLTFMTANAADFQGIPFITATVANLQTLTDTLRNLGADKITATAAAKDSTLSRGDARESLRDYLEYIAEIWRVSYDEVGGAANKYRVMPGNNDQNLIAAGRAFAATLDADKQVFTNQGVENTFITKIQDKADALEQAVIQAEAAQGEKVGTNAAFAEPARAARKLVDKLAPTVKRVYRNNPRKLSEWLVASHIERPPKKKSKDTDEKPE